MMMMMMMGAGNNNQMSTTQTEGGGSSGSSGGREDGVMLKKGPWTAAEDAVLADYVRTHGEGNWNAVQKNTGLARCGKSCRLRWANHLRPNLKKGAFSPEEERIIIELHAKMGNKWARMAAQLPGRTDNEIKNYWNTRVKRRQRQGLPLYPPDVQPLYSQHQHRYRHRHSQPPTQNPTPPPPTTSTSCFSFQVQTPIMSSMSSPLHPLHIPHRPPPQNFFYNPHSVATPPLRSPNSTSTPPPPLPSPSGCSTPNPISPLQSPHQPPPFPTLPLFGYPASSHSGDRFFHSHKRFKHDGSQSNNINNNSFMFSHLPHYSNRTTLDLASSPRTTTTRSFHHPNLDFGFFHPLKTELHSSQINNDGLLDNMLEEAQMMAGGNKEMQKEMNNTTRTTQPEEGEEDYSRLINYDGPTSMGMAINEWCNDSGESSDRQPSVITDNENHLVLDMHHLASLFPVDVSPADAARTSSVRSWDNFPGIC